jgi:hypothetical protein
VLPPRQGGDVVNVHGVCELVRARNSIF